MADVHSPKIRSYNMSQIKNRDTKPELLVRSLVHRSVIAFGFIERTFQANLTWFFPLERK